MDMDPNERQKKTIMEFLDDGKTSQMISCLGKWKLKVYWAFDNN